MKLREREEKKQREAKARNKPIVPPKPLPPKIVKIPTMQRNGRMPIAFA
jgi:hypothetical protein